MYTIKLPTKNMTASTPAEVMSVLKAKDVRVSESYARLIKKMNVGSTVHISGPLTRDVKASVIRNS